MSPRPICDVWWLGRARLKDGHRYYGAYPEGFVERARALLGVTLEDPVLHVCSGMIRYYRGKHAVGPNDKTLDIDPAVKPDFVHDARKPFPLQENGEPWPAILIDPPYSPEDAACYDAGSSAYPRPAWLVRNALEAVRPGGRVGILHQFLPKAPKDIRMIATVGILLGYQNRIRVYTVYEKPPGWKPKAGGGAIGNRPLDAVAGGSCG